MTLHKARVEYWVLVQLKMESNPDLVIATVRLATALVQDVACRITLLDGRLIYRYLHLIKASSSEQVRRVVAQSLKTLLNQANENVRETLQYFSPEHLLEKDGSPGPGVDTLLTLLTAQPASAAPPKPKAGGTGSGSGGPQSEVGVRAAAEVSHADTHGMRAGHAGEDGVPESSAGTTLYCVLFALNYCLP